MCWIKITKKRFKPLHHHAKRHYSKYKDSPRGIKILVFYTTILAALYFFLGLLFPTTVVFGHEITGPFAQIINLFAFFVSCTMIWGFLHRISWIWEFSIIWYIITIISSFFSIVTRGSDILKLLSDSLVLSSLVLFFINGLIIWYLVVRKGWFKHKRPHIHDDHDKVFIHFMTIFFSILILTMTFMVVDFYTNTTKMIDNNINEMRGKTVEEALFLCARKDQPTRDICFLTIAVSSPGLVNDDVCTLIFSNFYRLTCYEALS